MRRGIASTIVFGALGACGFSGDAPSAGFDGPPVVDAAIDADPGAGNEGPLPATEFCPRDPKVMVCFEFENTMRDGSMNRLDAKATNVRFETGLVSRGLRIDAMSSVLVNDSPVLDVGAITIQAWVLPTTLPRPGQRFGVVDVDAQYGVFINEGGEVSCTLGDLLLRPEIEIPATRWTHIACTYDGSTARIYLNGRAQLVVSDGDPMGRAGKIGMAIGANSGPGMPDKLIGLIDQVRLMNVARSAEEICRDVGLAECGEGEESD